MTDALRFRIHFTDINGAEDSVVIEGDTIEEVRELALAEVAKRDGQDFWSQEIT